MTYDILIFTDFADPVLTVKAGFFTRIQNSVVQYVGNII